MRIPPPSMAAGLSQIKPTNNTNVNCRVKKMEMSLRPPPNAKLAETDLRSCYGVRRLSWAAGLRDKKNYACLVAAAAPSLARASSGALGVIALIKPTSSRPRCPSSSRANATFCAPTRGQACGARRRNRSKKHFAGGERHPRYPGAILGHRGAAADATGQARARRPPPVENTNSNFIVNRKLLRVVGAGGRVKRTPHLPPP